CGTDRAEQIGPVVALVAWRPRPAATLGPNPCQGSLLADAGFILPPKFDRLAARAQWDAGCDQIGKVFLCAAWVAASCWGARRRLATRLAVHDLRQSQHAPGCVRIIRASRGAPQLRRRVILPRNCNPRRHLPLPRRIRRDQRITPTNVLESPMSQRSLPLVL